MPKKPDALCSYTFFVAGAIYDSRAHGSRLQPAWRTRSPNEKSRDVSTPWSQLRLYESPVVISKS